MIMFCRSCGSTIADQSTSCPSCGQPVQPIAPQQTAPVEQAAPQYYDARPPQAPPRKKRYGCLTALVVVLVIIIGGIAAIYFLLPGLLRPVDLGVPSSREAYESAMKKLGYSKDEAPQTGTEADYNYAFGPIKTVSIRLTSEEATSFMNYNRPSFFPVRNVQVKVGSGAIVNQFTLTGEASLSALPVSAAGDAPVEITGTISRDFVINNLLSGQFSDQEIQNALREIGIDRLLPANFDLYVKMSGAIVDNVIVNLRIYEASIMGIAIPQQFVTSLDARNIVSGAINKLLEDHNARSGAYFVSVRAANGEILIDGQIPSSLTRTPR